ncbi:transposase [Alteromonas lipolytica]|uniref:Transposase n=1 Tax=Alteromonas lipolytica TaxID=1856405 RepID=A0A1E8FCL5_9ALTE|nr:transposase [Alteromonas lipolytica]OFI33661.1 transposase [Alteromonas lipolytica]
MSRPRKALINLADTPYYHCVSRCVRRAYLCGKDEITGKSYEHRRQWVEDRLLFLAEVFCVDVCAYAVMSNHTHVVLRINKQKADALSVKDIIRRWHRLYKGMLLSQRYIDPAQCNSLTEAEIETVTSLAEIYRQRLYDISWFMRLLNEFIARRANKEDECTGHFWEGRFKSQALLDEASLAACMAYVDLNPVRACLADKPETSAHTSIQKRIKAARSNRQPEQLLPLAGNPSNNMPDGLPFRVEDYIQLVELSGRHFHPGRNGKIDDSASPILLRVGLEQCDWNKMVTGIETAFKSSVSVQKSTNQRKKHAGSG